MTYWDAIIIGTGPTGVSVAKPLIDNGFNVLFVDAGETSVTLPNPERPSLSDLRQGASRHWAHLLRNDLSALRDVGFSSPKSRTAAPKEFTGGFASAGDFETRSFSLTGAYALGGLTNIWGGVAPFYDDTDLAKFPIGLADLKESYVAIAEMVGLSGPQDAPARDWGTKMGPSLPLSRNASLLLRRDSTAAGGNADMRLAQPVLAVRTEDGDGRRACQLDKACMWGCKVGAVYNSSATLETYRALKNVTILTGEKVISTGPHGSGTETIAENTRTGKITKLFARTAVVAAGPAASVKIAYRSLHRINKPGRFFSCPAYSFALAVPKHLGASLETEGFGGAQLAVSIPLGSQGNEMNAFGLIYDADSMSASDLARHMFLTRPGAVSVLGNLLPALMVGLVYLPGEFSENTITYKSANVNERGTLLIEGRTGIDCVREIKQSAATLRKKLRQLGAWILPGSVKHYAPGAEVHYAGGLAMGDLTDSFGRVKGLSGVVVADASTFPDLPAKNHTFTAMANAHRIGTQLSNTLSN